MARITKRTMRAAARAERETLRKVKGAQRTGDSYQNFGLNLGIGTDNPLTGSTYGFNPVTRNRTLLEWIHRGSWIGGIAVDVVAEDMTRAGIEITCEAEPEQIDGVQKDLVRLGVWNGLRDTVAWSRLYGGSLGVMMIDGQDYSTPLDPKKIGKNQFRGVISLDRWMVEPDLSDLVSEQGPNLGLPKFYRVTSDIPGLRMKIIHYSRVIRFDGVRLPYWQRVSENLWGISVLERLYDRMVAFDSATTGAAQLAYKSYVRTYKVKGLREILAEGGQAEGVLIRYVDMMRRFQSIEGVTLIDGDDEFTPHSAVNMSGMSEALLQFGQQLSGALQIPLVRMFGQSPAGLNSTGESDLRTYYDGINQHQNSTMLVPMHTVVRAVSLSGGWDIPEDFSISFRPLWQLSEEQKSEVASRDTETTLRAEEQGVISQQTALKEMRQSSKVTGRWTNVTDKDIRDASDELVPRGEDAIEADRDALSDRQSALGEIGDDDQDKNDPKNQKDTFDAAKYDKREVDYAQGRGDAICGQCEYFLPENGCSRVHGLINFSAWCSLFDPVPVRTNDGSWPDFTAWNNEYTKILRKRNAAERAWRTEKDPVKAEKLKEKFHKAEALARNHQTDPNRPSSTVTRAFGRSRDSLPLSVLVAAQNKLDRDVSEASAALKSFPKTGPMGLTPDDVKRSPEYRVAKSRFDAAFKALRDFNGKYAKTIRKGTRDSLPVSEINGIPIAIETPRGTVRRGVSDGGHAWEVVMPADYGYIRRTPSAEGADECMDCFVGDVHSNTECHVIDSYDPDGNFDEHKVMLGFPSAREALACFHSAYNDGRRAGNVWTCQPDELLRWCETGDVTRPVGSRNLWLSAGEV